MSTPQRSILLTLSRPHSWMYLLGPFLVGVVAAPEFSFSFRLLLIGLFFTFPANLLIHGFGKIFDQSASLAKKKKVSLADQTQHRKLLNSLMFIGLAGMLLVYPASVPSAAKWAMTGFYFLGLGYSVPPIRAKTKPFLDSYFSVLYMFPGIVSYGLLSGLYPPVQIFLAGLCWYAAKYAYQAIPSIRNDKKTGHKTIATALGAKGALLFCTIHYLLAAALIFQWLGWFSVAVAAIYMWLMYASFRAQTKDRLLRLQSYFSYANMTVGTALAFYILLVLK